MKHAGFTLVELLIAITISTVALGLVTYFAIDLSSFGVDLGNRLETERELEMTLRSILVEIRSMGPADNGSYDIALANTNALTFYSDLDGDGKFEQVRYFLDGTTLKKGVTSSQGTPATYPPANENISETVHFMVPGPAIFTYYGTGDPSTTASLSSPVNIGLIRLVKIRGTTDRDPILPPLPTTLSVTATIRNLRGDI